MKVNSHIISGILIIMLGIVVLFSVIIINFDYYKTAPNFIKSECVIEDIDLERYTTTVIYIANGETITKKLNLYDSSFKIGTKTDIYYDKDEPIKSFLQCEVVYFNMLVCVGITIIITGIYFIINYFVHKRHFKYLLKNGKKIKADISSIDGKKFISFLPYHPSCICATAKIGNNQYNFLSETIYSNIINFMKEKNVKKIDVYINKEEIGDYYVDISSIVSKM